MFNISESGSTYRKGLCTISYGRNQMCRSEEPYKGGDRIDGYRVQDLFAERIRGGRRVHANHWKQVGAGKTDENGG